MRDNKSDSFHTGNNWMPCIGINWSINRKRQPILTENRQSASFSIMFPENRNRWKIEPPIGIILRTVNRHYSQNGQSILAKNSPSVWTENRQISKPLPRKQQIGDLQFDFHITPPHTIFEGFQTYRGNCEFSKISETRVKLNGNHCQPVASSPVCLSWDFAEQLGQQYPTSADKWPLDRPVQAILSIIYWEQGKPFGMHILYEYWEQAITGPFGLHRNKIYQVPIFLNSSSRRSQEGGEHIRSNGHQIGAWSKAYCRGASHVIQHFQPVPHSLKLGSEIYIRIKYSSNVLLLEKASVRTGVRRLQEKLAHKISKGHLAKTGTM